MYTSTMCVQYNTSTAAIKLPAYCFASINLLEDFILTIAIGKERSMRHWE